MGKGLLPNMVNVGWGTCMYISLNFPRNEAFFFLSSKSRGWGERRGRLQKAKYGGK